MVGGCNEACFQNGLKVIQARWVGDSAFRWWRDVIGKKEYKDKEVVREGVLCLIRMGDVE